MNRVLDRLPEAPPTDAAPAVPADRARTARINAHGATTATRLAADARRLASTSRGCNPAVTRAFAADMAAFWDRVAYAAETGLLDGIEVSK